MGIGVKNGLLFSLIAALPIWGVESYVNNATLKKTGKFKGNFIQDLVAAQEGILRPKNMVWTKALLKPIPTFLTSVAGTALIGISAGMALGPWFVGHAANRFEEVKKAKEEARQGLFQPKPPTLRQRLKLAKPPITKPHQAYQQLLDKELNSQHAFKEGATAVLLLKMLPALAPMAMVLALCGIRNRQLGKKIPSEVWQALDQFKLIDNLKLLIQPVFLVKTAALPIMGGFIAQQTIPWIRQQLGIDPP